MPQLIRQLIPQYRTCDRKCSVTYVFVLDFGTFSRFLVEERKGLVLLRGSNNSDSMCYSEFADCPAPCLQGMKMKIASHLLGSHS